MHDYTAKAMHGRMAEFERAADKYCLAVETRGVRLPVSLVVRLGQAVTRGDLI